MSRKKYRKVNKILSIVQLLLLAAIIVAFVILAALGIRLLVGNKKNNTSGVGKEAETAILREVPCLPEAEQGLCL